MSRLVLTSILLIGCAVLLAPEASGQRRTMTTAPNAPPAQAPTTAAATAAARDVRRDPTPNYGSAYVGGLSNHPGLVGPAVVGPAYGGYGSPIYPGVRGNITAGATLQGAADYVQAQGQYLNDVQQASLAREGVRQEKYNTYRKQLEWEVEYEKHRMTAPKMRAKEMSTELDWARNYATKEELWNGTSLNVLLRSILKAPEPTKGPYVSLDERQISAIQITDGLSRGNLSMTKRQGRIPWTEALQEAEYDEPREAFSKNFQAATKSLDSGEAPAIPTMRALRSDLKKLEDTLDDHVKELPPSRYIEARRQLNKLQETVRGFSDERVLKASRSDWKKDVRTVSDLVYYLQKNGMEFAGAADGEESAYAALYQAMRSYERGVVPQK